MRGFVKAYRRQRRQAAVDASTSIPEKGHEGVWAVNDATGRNMLRDIAAEKKQLAEKGGDFYKTLGGGVWMAPAVDKETNTVFFVAGNPSPDLYGAERSGRQPLHQLDGRGRPEHGHLQVALPVHRARRVGSGRGVAGDPDRSQGQGRQDAQGRDPRRQDRARLRARPRHRRADPLLRSDGAAGEHVGAADRARRAHAAGRQRRRRVEPDGGQPEARLAYAANLHQPMTYHVEEAKYPGGKLWLGGAFKVIPSEKQWGRLAAVNIDTGKMAWKFDTEQPLIGGVLATAGGLVFNGEGNGIVPRLRRRQRQEAVGVPVRRGRQRAGRVLHGRRQAVRRRGCGRQHPARLQARQHGVRVRAAVTGRLLRKAPAACRCRGFFMIVSED